jgi:hypothetical protein
MLMTIINQELYVALKSAKVPEDQAVAASRFVVGTETLATKAELKAEMSELKAEITNPKVIGFIANCVISGHLGAVRRMKDGWDRSRQRAAEPCLI